MSIETRHWKTLFRHVIVFVITIFDVVVNGFTSVPHPGGAELRMYSIVRVCLASSSLRSEKAWQGHRRGRQIDQARVYHGDVAVFYDTLTSGHEVFVYLVTNHGESCLQRL